MIAAERRQYIIDALHRENVVTVSQLSNELSVTSETIRHDLEKLADENVLWRVHGGAYLRTETNDREVPVDTRQLMSVEEKKLVSKACMEYIQDGDVLMLDNSTTVFYLVQELRRSSLQLTVITNSLNIIKELSQSPDQFHIIVIGGDYCPQYNAFEVSSPDKELSRYHAKKAIISCSGISSTCGLTDYNASNAAYTRAVLMNSDLRIFVSDHTKVEKNMLHVIGGLELLDYVVIDKAVDKVFLGALKENNIHFVNAKKQ
ncbi:DeoR/GlpR transcriptional regulator [Clostridium sp. AF19-22AC]|jgi:DeoR/GlpR family transcriptional regulator of sugar metabolism|uniref:DeoR/GlpR family DNA-binding transcription regulator n=1 Tax=Clostridia TaxID=186801 RepID=UPI000E483F48|nr:MULTISPECIES: DeoR/GlpR family DNA-binding transcription regulator [Clostridia]RHR32962.1 DeoR/GlpR transcriptional regulator [Clostridium sp. AF19-22AC]